MSDKNSFLVYSTDPSRNQKCPRCRRLVPECECSKQETKAASYQAILRIEKNGRGGKAVTVIDGLPRNDSFLETLARELKSKLGTGGTHRMGPRGGIVEIQGDKRVEIRTLLKARGIGCKG
ncbi:MAG TPA: hypothetical protein VL688_01510 [Verrucomicrobiae bacterium]|jgi:translation initiation factor 1|nr:hypothetical protein [Verrucomicrobiae bacterium]